MDNNNTLNLYRASQTSKSLYTIHNTLRGGDRETNRTQTHKGGWWGGC